MNEVNRVAKNTGILYARMGITVFISLYSTRLILNALGVSDFGLFNVVGGAIAMLTFLNNAMAGATQRFMSYAQGEGNFEKQKNIFNVSTIIHFVIGILIVLVLEVAGYFFFGGILKIPSDRIYVAKLIYQFMLASTFFSIISVPYDAVINAHENMLLVAILGILEAIFKLGIAIFVTYTLMDRLITYGVLMVALSICLLVIRRIYCHRKYLEVEINIRKFYNKTLFKEMTSFAGWSLIGTTTSVLASYGQGIVLNVFFGTIVNAAQGIASQVSGQLSVFAGTMLKALNPMIDKSEGAGNRLMLLKASMIGSKTSFFLLMFTFIPVLVEMPYIFGIWLKDIPEFTIVFCRLLLLRNLVEQLYATLTSTIAAVGNIRKFTIVVSFFYFMPIVVSYFIFKLNYPAYSLYVVFLIFSMLTFFVVLYFSKINCGISVSEFMKNVVLRSISSFIIVFCFSIIPTFFLPSGFMRLSLVVFIAVCAFIVVIWFVGFNAEERYGIKAMKEGIVEKLKGKLKLM